MLPFTDVIVKSSNVGAIKVGLQARPAAARPTTSAASASARRSRPDFRGETAGIVWNPAQLDRERAGVGLDGLPGRRDAAADGDGGQLDRQRRRAASSRASCARSSRTAAAIEVPHKVLRQTVTAETAATLTTIMEAGRRARHRRRPRRLPGYTIAGKTGTAAKLVNGHYSKSDYNASFVGFVPSRKPALTILVVIDSPHGNGYYGGAVSAPIFKRIAEATLRYLGIAPTLNAPPPVLVARHDPSRTVRDRTPVTRADGQAATALEPRAAA